MDQDDRREWEESRTRTLALLQDPEASRALVRAIARQDEAYVSTNEILAALCVTVAGMMEEPCRPVVMVMDDPGPVGQAFVSYWRERLAARVSYSP